MSAPKPVGKIHVIGVEEIRHEDAATYVKVICVDDAWQRWFFFAESFAFDLLPYTEEDKDGAIIQSTK